MPASQVINSEITGPVFSNGGRIEITSTGIVESGPAGIDAEKYSITVLWNAGTISASAELQDGQFGVGVLNHENIGSIVNLGDIFGVQYPFNQPAGGDALLNLGWIGAIRNFGKISGGSGGASVTVTPDGGAGLVNQGDILVLANGAGGLVLGGAGVSGYHGDFGGKGGVGVDNQGEILAFLNVGTIDGGAGGVAITAGNGAARRRQLRINHHS